MKKFEEEFNYLIELSGKVLIGQAYAKEFEKHRANFINEYGKKQQPEIPEVPPFVADWYEENKHRIELATFSINANICVKSSKARCDIEDWFADAENKPIETIFAMKNGYTVAKEKRFYLKNKLTGDCLARCLARGSDGLYVEVTEKWLTRKEQTSYKLSFTQSEIDSMAADSYEQIEVEE